MIRRLFGAIVLLNAAADTGSGGAANPPPAAPPAAGATPPAAAAAPPAASADGSKSPPAAGAKPPEAKPKRQGLLATPPPEKKPDAAAATPPADGKPAADAKPAGEGAPAPLEVKLPEGLTIDEKLLVGFKDVASKVGLDSAKASELATWYAGEQQKMAQAAEDAWDAQGEAWNQELREDPEFGGANYDANSALAQKAVVAIGGPALVQELGRLRIGDNPILAKSFAKLGRMLAEDNSVQPGKEPPAAPEPRNTQEQARAFYTDMPPRK